MALDQATVARIARLARIHMEPDALAPLAGELSAILGWIEQLDEVDTDGVEPMTSVVEMALPERADRLDGGGDAEAVLANAPAAADGYYVVPKVVE